MASKPRIAFNPLVLALLLVLAPAAGRAAASARTDPGHDPGPPGLDLDTRLRAALARSGFTGRIESTLESRLGRPVDPARADLGRLLFFDRILGLHDDNSCAGCHAPAFGFGDSQRMAIGVQNNGVVGPNRRGPRNQRRSPPGAAILQAGLDPLLRKPTRLTDDEFGDLVEFVVLEFCDRLPESVPSGLPLQLFEGCPWWRRARV